MMCAYIKSGRLDVRMHSSWFDFFLMCSARSECKLKMKMTSENVEIHESSTFPCLYKKTHNLRFCECLLHLKALYEHLYFSIGWFESSS